MIMRVLAMLKVSCLADSRAVEFAVSGRSQPPFLFVCLFSFFFFFFLFLSPALLDYFKWRHFVFHGHLLCYRDISGALLTTGSWVRPEASRSWATMCLGGNKNRSCDAISNRAAAICWLESHGEQEESSKGQCQDVDLLQQGYFVCSDKSDRIMFWKWGGGTK